MGGKLINTNPPKASFDWAPCQSGKDLPKTAESYTGFLRRVLNVNLSYHDRDLQYKNGFFTTRTQYTLRPPNPGHQQGDLNYFQPVPGNVQPLDWLQGHGVDWWFWRWRSTKPQTP